VRMIHDASDTLMTLSRPRSLALPGVAPMSKAANCLPNATDSNGRLVAVQPEVFARVVGPLAPPEHASALLVQRRLADKLLHGLARLERWVELYEGVGPQVPPLEGPLDLLLDPGVLYADEAPDVGRVVPHQATSQLEYVQSAPSRFPCRTGFAGAGADRRSVRLASRLQGRASYALSSGIPDLASRSRRRNQEAGVGRPCPQARSPECPTTGVKAKTGAANMRPAAAKTGPPTVPPSVASPFREYLHPPLPRRVMLGTGEETSQIRTFV